MMVEERIIYFNEELHKYTDQFSNVYTSATTKLSEYEQKQDFKKIAMACERIGKNPEHRNYYKYKGKTAQQLLKEWKLITDNSLDRGNTEHNYLEISVKLANGFESNYKKGKSLSIGNKEYTRMYSIYDLKIGNLNDVGEISIEELKVQNLHIRYPDIFNLIVSLHKKGFKFYPEIVVYHPDWLISGMVDLLAVRGNEFIIIDWKTNKGDISFEAGYYEKDSNGDMTNVFHKTGKTFKYPIQHLPASTGHKYSLQLSLYAYFIERFGFKLKGLLLFHITHNEIKESDNIRWRTKPIKIEYFKDEIEAIGNDIILTGDNRNTQYNAFK
jgi:hypothetical protein